MKLRLYVGVIAANAQLQLSWASQPASSVSNKSFTGSAKKVKNGVYSIDLRPPVANDALNVKWVLSTSPRPRLSRVRLYSATLSAG
jgi:hypothetical protein